MPHPDADKIARAYRGNDPAGPVKDDGPLIDYALMFADWGVPPDQIADWMLAPGFNHHKRLHHRLGFTSQQYQHLQPVIEALYETSNELTMQTPVEEVQRWYALGDTVPTDFLALCIRAGVTSDAEIADFDARRAAGDPEIHGQLEAMAGLLGGM